MTTGRPVIKVYTSREEQDRWKVFCRANEVSCSEALRSAMLRLMRQGVPRETPEFTAVAETPDARTKRRVHLRLTQSEHEKLTASAAADEVSPTQWFVNLARARLTRDPQLGMAELTILGDSNRQLAAIGSNLNQIARRVNSDRTQFDQQAMLSVLQQVEELKQEIDEHLSQVRRVMLANRERWLVQ